ncbi:hypothetical protein [Mesonia aestuariivivens]|uniref:Uncharacterized protein n=1 Tax=Mesonia aestuariivivens TaxID=2796128 RepID=A0ABS6W160_9FLAO|nr:hypothetical protein [Mesonia aestuariivivens]MBW2961277.1 hypothetical protein [Mesonia aestuariivivens]
MANTENVKIAEIDIGVDKILAKAAQTKKQIAELEKSQKALKTETDSLTNATQEQLEAYTLGEIELKKYKKEVRDGQKVLDAYIHIQNQDIRTKDQARDANRKLIAIANQLDASNEDQAATLKKVNAEIDRNTDFIKDNASEYEKTKINIGNYKEQVTEALEESGLFGQEIKQVTNITQNFAPVFNTLRADIKQGASDIRNASAETEGMSNSQKLLAASTKATSGMLRIFRAALIGTGIGAIVVVLGSLIAYLTTTQSGIDKVNKVLTPMKEIFGTLLGIVQEFGEEIFEAISNPKKSIKQLGEMIKQNLINRFVALANIVDKVLNFEFDGIGDDLIQAGTGVEDLTGKISKLGEAAADRFGEAWERGKQIEEITQNLSKTEAQYITQQAKLRKEFEEQKKLSDDISQSTKVREEAAANAIQLQKEISQGSIERIKQEAEILRLKQEANDTSDAEKAELATKLAEIDKALEEEAAKTTEAQNKLNSIRKEGADKAIEQKQRILDAAIEKQQQELDLYLAQQGIKAKSLEEELQVAKEVSKRKLEILKSEYEAGEISKTEYETEKFNITNEFAQKQIDVTIANAERELQIFKDSHQSKLDSNQFLNEQLFQEERNRLNNIAQAEREFQQKRLEEGAINQQDYNDEIARIDDENYKNQEKLRAEREQAKNEKQAFELELQREQEAEQFQNKFDLELAREQQRYEAELAAAERLGVDTTAIKKKHADIQEDIEEKKESAIRKQTADTFGEVSKLLGEKTAAGKAAGIASATMNTYEGVTQVWASDSVLPEPAATIQKGISTGVVLASGLKAVKNIAKTKVPKAAQGIAMDLEGPSHSSGGIKLFDESGNPLVEAQGGEKMVILKREASKELGVLSALNQKHGGVSLSKPVSYAANGGAVIRNPQTPRFKMRDVKFDYDMLGNVLADRVNSIQTVVPVDQITDVATRAANVEQGADF